ncbi:putative TOS1-like glycosyl hydrolase-domain-containing protein [Phaeosphaeriaceae sp. PMI808]|nr:putative TOS1-like glycosyl hydrolase-domain-containing protein [Phaeosphaeriaceae sp. PMI808]
MIHFLLITSCLLPLTFSKTSGELCRGTVWAITYRNISQAGAYNRTTNVDPKTGLCGHERVLYEGNGPLTPLFGEVSMHIRGPMNVSQLAVYQLPGEVHTLQKRKSVPFFNRRRALNKREADPATQAPFQDTRQGLFLEKRTSNTTASYNRRTVMITTGSTTTTEPNRNTTRSGPLPSFMPTSNTPDPDTILSSSGCTYRGTPPPANQSSLKPVRENVRRTGADWSRVAYYTSAAPAQASGLSFLANLGDPQKSGTFDYAFGNSLSYVSSDGGKVTSDSMPFIGTLDTSEREIAVFSDKACDQDCPYSRPDATSHYGWSGSSKAFFTEFQMDHYPNRGSDQGLISDAPAWWFLNAAIPRILQYGNDRNNIPCSCWSTGCGEFDAFEVLGNGEERAKSTMHRQGNLQGGDSNYFKRPVGKKLKFAVIWHYPHITARILDSSFDFSSSLSNDQMQRLVAYDADSWVHSLFAIGD